MKTKELKKFAKELKKFVNEEFGKECSSYDFGCVICNAHRVALEVAQLASLCESVDKQWENHKHKA